MSYKKATLIASTKEAIEADIKGIEWKGETVYPNYPEGYEKSFALRERFIVTEPRREVISLAVHNENGHEVTPPVLGNWTCNLVLPEGYPIESLDTLQSE